MARSGTPIQRSPADLIVGRLPLHGPHDDLDLAQLFEDPVLVVAAKHKRWARTRKLSLAELAEEPWVLQGPQTKPWRRERSPRKR